MKKFIILLISGLVLLPGLLSTLPQVSAATPLRNCPPPGYIYITFDDVPTTATMTISGIGQVSNGATYQISCSDDLFLTENVPTGWVFYTWTENGGGGFIYSLTQNSNEFYVTGFNGARDTITAIDTPYYSNGNEGGTVTGHSSNSVTTSLGSNLGTQNGMTWSYQYNLFWDISGTYYVSQTVIEDLQSLGCNVGTGYGMSDPYETQHSINCSSITSSGDNWAVATSWASNGDLQILTFYLNGAQVYSLSQSQICTGYPSCHITQSTDAYFQSVFVGSGTTSAGNNPSATFTSLSGTMSYSGLNPRTGYPACTGEYSNAEYLPFSGSYSQSFQNNNNNSPTS